MAAALADDDRAPLDLEPLPDGEDLITEIVPLAFLPQRNGCRSRLAAVASGTAPIDDRVLRALATVRPRWIALPIDGADAAQHDAYHGHPGGFLHVLRALEACRNLGLGVRLLTHLHRGNRDAIEPLASIARWFSAQRWVITFAAHPEASDRHLPLAFEERAAARTRLYEARAMLPATSLCIDAEDGAPATSQLEADRRRLSASLRANRAEHGRDRLALAACCD